MSDVMWRLRRRIVSVCRYIKGRLWCRRFHKPVFYNIGGYGGRDVWGRRRKEYHGFHCWRCGNRWDQSGRPKPLTTAQRRACADAFGSLWVGDRGEAAEEES